MSLNRRHRPSPFSAALRQAAARVQDGTHQSARAPEALRPDHFLVDERALQDRIAMAARFAAHLRFIGPEPSSDGTWAGLFDADEGLLLARMATDAGQGADAVRYRDLDAIDAPTLIGECRRLAHQIVQWRTALGRVEGVGAQVLVRAIDDMMQARMAREMSELADVAVDPIGPDDAVRRDRLRDMLTRFSAATLRLRELALEQFHRSFESGRHEPAAALVIAFMQLMGTVQQHVNRFTDRHTDFYFDEVLRMRAKPARPDSAHLVVSRDPRLATELVLPRGTPFSAGKDAAGHEVVFRADEDLPVVDARVAELCTLRFERDPLISPEHELGYVNRVRSHRLPGAPSTGAVGGSLPRWPLFGGSELAAAGDVQEACLGLAIASPQLLLLEGEREVRITLRLSQSALVDARLRDLAARHGALAQPDDALLEQVFQGFIDQDRQGPREGAATPGQMAAAASARLAALAKASGGGVLPCFRQFLLQRVLQSTGEAFRFALGQLFVHWLLSHQPGARPTQPSPDVPSRDVADWLTPDDLAELRRVASQALSSDDEAWDAVATRSSAGRTAASTSTPTPPPGLGDPLALILGTQPPDRDLVFARLFTGLFAVSYSAPGGWQDAPGAHVIRPLHAERFGTASLQVVMRLGRGDPPVVGCVDAVHGAFWRTRQPLVRLRLRAYGGLFPCSMMESALLLDLSLAVQVRGLRQVVLHNQLGRLDPSKPFNPFGPLPTVGSTLVLGSPEIARKRLTALTLHLQWGGLPSDSGGFAAHYEGYSQAIDNRSFGVALSVLRDGQWQPQTERPRAVPLFAADLAVGPLAAASSVGFDAGMLRDHFHPVGGEALDRAASFDLSARQGFVRMQLIQPAGAFGHAEYPNLLTRTLTSNVRKRHQLDLPRAPYTPLIEGLSVDYAAEHLISLDGEPSPGPESAADKVYHLHPFGVQQVQPRPDAGACRLLPLYRHDGNLFIGLGAQGAQGVQGRLTLLFHLDEEAAVVRRGTEPPVTWSYLVGDAWRRLPARNLLSDGTAGLLTSGIVVIDLPEDTDTRHSVMPDGLVWLGLGADRGFERFAGLHGVHANALRVTRVLDDPAAAAPQPLSAGSLQAPPWPGLAAAVQVGPSFGARAAESRWQMRIRTGERLRHKQRASVPWDFERLVLEQFPQVCKAKCFSASEIPGAKPGRVVLAVVASPQRFDRAAGKLYPRLNAIELKQIADLLKGLMSPFAVLEVRNAALERIQLRCCVHLAPGVAAGSTLQRIDRAVFDFLSPWCEGGLEPSFGWVVRSEDIEARIRGVPGVVFVTGISMLHIAESDGGYHALGDTVRVPGRDRSDPVMRIAGGVDGAHVPRIRPGVRGNAAGGAGAGPGIERRVEVRPLVPWSIAVPMAHHTISTVMAGQTVSARASGIADLSIGSNLIIGGTEHG